jgi:hypothetical protein
MQFKTYFNPDVFSYAVDAVWQQVILVAHLFKAIEQQLNWCIAAKYIG